MGWCPMGHMFKRVVVLIHEFPRLKVVTQTHATIECVDIVKSPAEGLKPIVSRSLTPRRTGAEDDYVLRMY